MSARVSAAERAALPVARAALESRASAYGVADTIVFALGGAQLLQSPETAAELAALRVRVAELEKAASADLTVYRASHESIVIGHYTTARVAREHCEAYVRREHPGAVLDWIADEDDDLSPAELAEQVGDEEALTGYVVTPVSVAAEFDADGDE